MSCLLSPTRSFSNTRQSIRDQFKGQNPAVSGKSLILFSVSSNNCKGVDACFYKFKEAFLAYIVASEAFESIGEKETR